MANNSEHQRLGQMIFLLGLCQYDQKKTEAAHLTWQHHVDSLPEDRFAMLSRVHHKNYAFSPFRSDNRTVGGVFGSTRRATLKIRRPSKATIERMLNALEEGDSVRVQGKRYRGEALRRYLEKLGVEIEKR